jgi:hypothetical protein
VHSRKIGKDNTDSIESRLDTIQKKVKEAATTRHPNINAVHAEEMAKSLGSLKTKLEDEMYALFSR